MLFKKKKYPTAINKKMIGEYPALSKSGGGYFYDEILEYRVWCRPWLGAPDEHDGEVYYHPFFTFEEAKVFSNATEGSEEPIVLVKQLEWIDEPTPNEFIHKKTERITEWKVEWLDKSKRKKNSIKDFINNS